MDRAWDVHTPRPPCPFLDSHMDSLSRFLGLIAFEPRLKRVWYLVALNAFVMLGLQIRAEWVGFLVGLAVFAWCTKRIKQVAVAGTLLAVLFGVMFLTNLDLQSPEGRGGEISVSEIVARAVAR